MGRKIASDFSLLEDIVGIISDAVQDPVQSPIDRRLHLEQHSDEDEPTGAAAAVHNGGCDGEGYQNALQKWAVCPSPDPKGVSSTADVDKTEIVIGDRQHEDKRH